MERPPTAGPPLARPVCLVLLITRYDVRHIGDRLCVADSDADHLMLNTCPADCISSGTLACIPAGDYSSATMALQTNERMQSPRASHASLVVQEPSPPTPRPPKLLDRVREANRLRHASRSTEKSYVGWICRYILFHGKRHPAEMGAPEVSRFLSSLAVQGKVAASTQNQALSALLFLYRHVLHQDLPWLEDVLRAKRPKRLPVVLTRDEVRAIVAELHGTPRLMATLLYGSGLRLLECCRLRVQDIDFGTNQIVVRDGKGAKDRVTILPTVAKNTLTQHLQRVKRQHEADLARAGSSCRGRLPASIPTPAASGRGNGPSRPPGSTSTAPRASAAAITSTRPWCSAP